MDKDPHDRDASGQEDPAWIRYREMFASVYDDANYASPLQAFVMHASHRLTERALPRGASYDNVVEIGAGTGEHVRHVHHRFDRYVLTDVDPQALEVARKKLAGSGSNLAFEVQQGPRFSYADNSFDRLVATHVLEHIPQPHLALREWSRIVKPGGILSILIPTDPGLAWRLGRHLGPRRNALRQGIAYDYVMAREHVNPCNNLVALLRHQFPTRVERWWPLRVPAMDLNLFFLFQAINNKD